MKALVLGCGSIGLRHIGHLQALGISEVEAADPNPIARDRAMALFGVTVDPEPEEALERRPDIVLVCTPVSAHIPMAIKALKVGAHLFVEKPLSTSLEGLEELVRSVQEDGRIVQVGYQLRYHPAMRATKRVLESGRLGKILSAHAEFGLYLERWWPGRDYRDSYMAKEGEGGGLLLDASHEIDLILWFLGPVREVSACGGKLSSLEIEGQDLLKVMMRMESGALVSLHVDCLQPTYARSYAFIGQGTALKWECLDGRADKSLGQLRVCDAESEDFKVVPLGGDPAHVYLEELRDFLSSVRSKRPPFVGVRQSIEVLRVIAAIQKAVLTRSWVPVEE